MSKHTPGPWKVAKPRKSYRDGNMMYGIVGPECVIDYEDWGFTRANARLIAAAPDLLAVLKAFSDYVHQEQSATDGAVTYSTTAINHWAFLARAAIAKATGGAA